MMQAKKQLLRQKKRQESKKNFIYKPDRIGACKCAMLMKSENISLLRSRARAG
jgi:hypothetical protein